MPKKKIYISETPLIEEWDFEKNSLIGLDPTTTAHMSNKRAWWFNKDCGHSWDTVISRRSDGDGCVYCSNRRLLKGFNDFATRYPEHAKDWSPENNIKVDSFIMNGTTKYLWVCRNGKHEHSYPMTAKHKARGQNCGICDGKTVLKGFNDFGSNFPELLKEWDYELNEISPFEITSYNFKAVHWICKESHRWKVSLINRTNKGTGCPDCSKMGFSQQEKDFTKWLSRELEEMGFNEEIVSNDKKVLGKRELDVYIPNLKLAFEYNGEYWHDKSQYELDRKNNIAISKEMIKEKDCSKLGIRLIQVWSNDWRKNNDKEIKRIKSILRDSIVNSEIG